MRTLRPAGRQKPPDHSAQDVTGRSDRSHSQGKLFIVGVGPGSRQDMSLRAVQAIEASDTVVGYETYLGLVSDLTKGKEVISYGMKEEMVRANRAIDEALAGKTVALVSSGDSGIYGMAGPVLEAINQRDVHLDLEIVPGIAALNACAAVLGAPLMNDFAVISLSDLLAPWDIIRKRLEAASEGDFVVVLYNPGSRGRTTQIAEARDILLRCRPSQTPVGIVSSARRQKEAAVITTLGEMLQHPIDMLTTIIIGNSTTFAFGQYLVTPRGYQSPRKKA